MAMCRKTGHIAIQKQYTEQLNLYIMLKIKNIFALGLLAVGAGSMMTSCNDDWKEEQYANYISFKAPLDAEGGLTSGVTTVYVPYTRLNSDMTPMFGREGVSNYKLPLIVAGSNNNPKTVTVNIEHSDTLDILNVERFGHREEIYYKDMSDFAEYSPTITIPEGQNTALLDINLDFTKNGGFDLIDRYVLPLRIAPGAGYERHPRKNYATAMLHILPYTDFSGIFSATNMLYCITDESGDGETAGMINVQTYACGQYDVFFYAGTNKETSLLRKNFRIYAHFTPDPDFEPGEDVVASGTVQLYVNESENPELNFRCEKLGSYKILQSPDPVLNYVIRRTLVLQDIEYYYTDTKTAPGTSVTYKVAGGMTMERKLNTQMPEEDQIMWE